MTKALFCLSLLPAIAAGDAQTCRITIAPAPRRGLSVAVDNRLAGSIIYSLTAGLYRYNDYFGTTKPPV